MGRGRLRRGCSLEVIFEEDPDFCSHLDSLDGGVAIRFGIKEPDDTISLDSLLEVEEYQVRFEDPADAEQVFRSLDGFIDVRNMDSCMVEWDEFSMDSNSSRIGEDDTGNGTTEKDSLLDSSDTMNLGRPSETDKAPSGRRSRVSRRQIIQATWLGYSSSSDESITNHDPDDIDKNNNATTVTTDAAATSAVQTSSSSSSSSRTQRRRSPTNRHLQKGKAVAVVVESERKSDNDGSGEEPTSITSTASSSASIKRKSQTTAAGSRNVNNAANDDDSIVSVTTTEVSPNLVGSVEDFPENDNRRDGGGGGGRQGLKTPPIQLHLRMSPSNNNNASAPHGIFGRITDTIDIGMEKDTLDSYISTMTDETDANAYTFADPFDDTHSVASTNYESSGSTSSTESNGSSVCTVNSFSMKNGRSKSNGNEGKTGNSNSSGGSENTAGFNSINSSNGSGSSKYKSNLKVELVSQLNKSQERTLQQQHHHPAISPANSNASTLIGLPTTSAAAATALQLDVSGTASSSATVNPSPHLYSTNSHLNLESPSSSSTTPFSLKLPPHRQQQQQMSPYHLHHQPLSSTTDHERQSLSGEVKRVRALFELRNHSRSNGSGSSSNGSTCPSSPESSNRSASARNGNGSNTTNTNAAAAATVAIAGGENSPPCESASRRVGLYSKNGRRPRGSPPNSRSSASPSKVLKTTFSNNASPTQSNSNSRGSPAMGNSPSYDYEDILVNENVVIEDSPDLFQATRSRRNGNFDRDSVPSPPISNKRPITIMNLSPGDGTPPSTSSTSPSSSTSAVAAAAIASADAVAAAEGSLRRSQSMGTGISSLGSPSSSAYGVGILKQTSSKTNILAEELPAPDTVKNVRNVFENMLKMRGKKNNHGSESSVDITSNIITPSSFSGSFSIVKKSLSYIKSNPTSKIYRSESMRDDFPSMGGGRRCGKPVLLSEQNSPAHSPNYPLPGGGQVAPSSSSPTFSSVAETVLNSRARCSGGGGGDVVDGRSKRSSSSSPTNKNATERRISSTSQPVKFSLKINTGLSPSCVPSMLRSSACSVPLNEEDPSFSSNVSNAEDYRTRKFVHSDVLQKIRSAGTTTTYFGGKIVAKTVKNRKIPVARRHTFDFQDYVGINGGEGTSFANYDSYNSSNYYHRNDENRESKFSGHGSSSSSSNVVGISSSSMNIVYERRDRERPALEIPLKSSTSSNIYAHRSNTTTISGALDSIFAGGVGAGLLTFASKPIDTTPRIISVLHKSPPGSQTGSPVKSCSPVSSVIDEGRNSPEGCEASNEKTVEQDGNNNNLPGKIGSPSKAAETTTSAAVHCTGESEAFNKKFSQITEGAWF